MTGPVETKTAAATLVPVLAATVFAAAAYWHWFTPPPPALAASLTALATGLAGWLAPHTPRNVKTPLTLTAAEADSIKRMLASVRVMPASPSGNVRVVPGTTGGAWQGGGGAGGAPAAVQPPATGTGGTTP